MPKDQDSSGALSLEEMLQGYDRNEDFQKRMQVIGMGLSGQCILRFSFCFCVLDYPFLYRDLQQAYLSTAYREVEKAAGFVRLLVNQEGSELVGLRLQHRGPNR